MIIIKLSKLICLCCTLFASSNAAVLSVLTAKRIIGFRNCFALRSQEKHDVFPVSSKESLSSDLKAAALRSMYVLAPIFLSVATVTAPAVADSIEEANTKLADYGLPPILFTPPGFTNLVSEFGRGNIKEQMKNPLLVQFAHPSLWVVQKTSVNNNGEAGTISANDYYKGDSAFFFVWPTDKADSLAASNTALVKEFVLKSLSQKGDPVDALKIFKISEGAKGADGKPYLIVDFGYQLNTQAGFLIDRRAVASLISVGSGQLQGLVAVSTEKRFKSQTEAALRAIAESFRVYKLNSGVFAT